MRLLPDIGYLDEHVRFPFPPAESANRNGIVCYGGRLSPGLLLSAYRQGIFPWPSNPRIMQWCSPDPRFVIPSGFLHVSESARRRIRKVLASRSGYRLTLDTAFRDVITACASVPRPGQDGTWIFPELIEAYTDLHRRGYAHSVELWNKDALIGGLYGVSLGAAFFGESMFSRESNASKTAFLVLAMTLFERGFEFIDCQVYTHYLELMGAILIPRRQYLAMLAHALQKQDLKGPWPLFFPEFPDAETIMSRLHTWRSPLMDDR